MGEQTQGSRASARSTRQWPGTWGVRLFYAALALAAVGGIVAWLVIVPGGSKPTAPTGVEPVGPVALSASGLHTLAASVGQPIYWAGPARGHMYELTRTTAGNVYIRYLPHGVKAGAPGAKYLVVGTYPYAGAFAALKAAAGKKLAVAGGHGIALVDSQRATNVRVAFPGVGYQIEVYDPLPRVARSIATSGALQPVNVP